jgi:Pan3 Pseudokinase domain
LKLENLLVCLFVCLLHLSALCFLYDFYPCAATLQVKYFGRAGTPPVPEETLWSFIAQLISALMSIHSLGMAYGCMHPSRILVTETNRLRLSWTGVNYVFGEIPQLPLPDAQFDDMFNIGRIVLCLACQNASALERLGESIDLVGRRYSADLKNLLMVLLNKPKNVKPPSVVNISSLISHRIVGALQSSLSHCDTMRSSLAKEAHNGRLFRLMVKMGFINERPEFKNNPRWSETEDRYLIKLLRDYIFHTVNDDGTPNLDFAHVVQTLNKLDAGSQEKALLMGRDDESMLIVSFADLRRCIQEAYLALKASGDGTAASASAMQMGVHSGMNMYGVNNMRMGGMGMGGMSGMGMGMGGMSGMNMGMSGMNMNMGPSVAAHGSMQPPHNPYQQQQGPPQQPMPHPQQQQQQPPQYYGVAPDHKNQQQYH